MKSDVRSMAGLDRMLGSQVLIRVSLGSTLFETVGEVVRLELLGWRLLPLA